MLLQPLYDRIWEATAHRLRGVHAVLGGWALLGTPEEDQPQIQARLAEDRELLGRLEWLREAERGGSPEALATPARALVALAAGAFRSTPETCDALPAISDPLAAVAVAAWAAATATDGVPELRLLDFGGVLEIVHEPSAAPPAPWREAWAALFGPLALEAGERGVRVGGGAAAHALK